MQFHIKMCSGYSKDAGELVTFDCGKYKTDDIYVSPTYHKFMK